MQRRLLRLSRFRIVSIIPIFCIGSFLLSNKCNAASSATLTLGTTQKLETTVTQGNTAYLSSTIKVDATDIESYTLSISGPVGLAGGSTITGANNKTPANMTNNSWGYAYNDSNANNAKTYKSFTGSAQTLETGTTPSGTAKNITFAAKFASDATPAHYSGSITINLVATPKQTAKWSNSVDSGIDNMQDIKTGFCQGNSSVPNGSTIALKDNRETNKSYTVRKMEDGKCWMIENLSIINKSISATDSDLTSGSFIIPISSISGFTSNDASNAYLSGLTGYYTWCAATAGSCTNATSSGQTASNSVCPKNWKLPTGGSGGEFQSFVNAAGISSTAVGSNTIRSSVYNFTYTGRVFNGSLDYGDTQGEWWSRTAGGNGFANAFSVSNTSVSSTGVIAPGREGYAVRCVAQY